MKAAAGALVGLLVGIVLAYAFAIVSGIDGPVVVVFVPLGLIIGWRAGAVWGSAKTCPDCRSSIPRDAAVCKECGYRFAPELVGDTQRERERGRLT